MRTLKKALSLSLALALSLTLAVPAFAVTEPAGPQALTVAGDDEVYDRILRSLMFQPADRQAVLTLHTDFQLTGNPVILGTSDYDGQFRGETITVQPHDVVIDLNGYTITSEVDYPIFEVQAGYTLTIIDSSADKTGKLVAQGETDVVVEEGGTYIPLAVPTQPEQPASAFTDVPSGEFYAAPVQWAVEKGITAGTSKTKFSPASKCNRAQILSFLYRANGSPEPTIANPFSDIKESDFYYKAALWAAEKGIVSGTTFDALTPCTRASTMEYMWKAAGSPAATYDGRFNDVAAGSDYAQAVAWALEHNVTAGTSATKFSPNSTCTRGQIVTFLYRAFAE